MIKDFKLLNYKEKVYKIFIEKKTLYINFEGKTKMISDNVLDYCLEYFDKSLWVSLYNERGLIYLFEITIEEYSNVRINKKLVLDIQKYSEKIDSLTMIIKNANHINLIFRGWKNNKAFIFNSNISICENFNIISDNALNSKFKPFSTYVEEDKAMILISEKNECEEYVLYNLIKESTEESFLIPHTSNIFIVKYNEKPTIFYNKEIDGNFYMKYRYLNLEKEVKNLYEEKDLNNVPENIANPRISVYMGMIYLVWKNKNYIRSAISRDLNNWNVNYTYQSMSNINTNIIKIFENRVEKISTYMQLNKIYSLITNREKFKVGYDTYKLLELLFYENSLNKKIDNITNLINIKDYYNKQNEEYLIKIRELNSIIEDKDKLIYKLLNR